MRVVRRRGRPGLVIAMRLLRGCVHGGRATGLSHASAVHIGGDRRCVHALDARIEQMMQQADVRSCF